MDHNEDPAFFRLKMKVLKMKVLSVRVVKR
jgi:hypothetical protein